MLHPLHKFTYCPVCGAEPFAECNGKAKQCDACGFVYYLNPSAAVACFIRNARNELLLVRRSEEPAKGTLDLPGGFADMYETAEEALYREAREETGLRLANCRYLFSAPNVYPYMGFDVHTLDLFFECKVDSFVGAKASDDAAALVVCPPSGLDPAGFGLQSIRQAVRIYSLLAGAGLE